MSNPEKKEAASIKNYRYALLKNPENLTDRQKEQLEFLVDANPRLYRAYLLKKKLRLALKAAPDKNADELTSWMAWAQRCRILGFRDLRLKIKRHFNAIIAAAKYGLSNARGEAINNKIKLTIRMEYGFRNVSNTIAMIMLRCSEIQPEASWSLILPTHAHEASFISLFYRFHSVWCCPNQKVRLCR